MDLEEHLRRQIAWSRATFGPGTRQGGVIDHIRKELREVETAETQAERIKEWTDVVILGLDGLWREIGYGDGLEFVETTDVAARDVVESICRKQSKNELRNWPDWRTMSADKAIEHVRQDGEPPKVTDPRGISMQAAALAAVARLVEACDREMAGPTCADEPDDEHVASTLDGAGKVVPAGSITFGMIREAVAGVAMLKRGAG